MIKISVLYPSGGDDAFDSEYYATVHMPLVKRLSGGVCKEVGAQRGLAGGAPGSAAPYVAIGEMLFDSIEAFQSSLGPHMAEITADIAKFTKIAPVMQISEVTL